MSFREASSSVRNRVGVSDTTDSYPERTPRPDAATHNAAKESEERRRVIWIRSARHGRVIGGGSPLRSLLEAWFNRRMFRLDNVVRSFGI